jgi:hypothetical protein
LRFTLEARQAVRIANKDVGQKFERNVAIQLRVARAIGLALLTARGAPPPLALPSAAMADWIS